ncbi:MAG: signal peptide peptidase SppA [Bdellovibrionota bacterium]
MLSGGGVAVFLLLSGILFMREMPGGHSPSAGRALFGKGSVGVIEINGVIMDSKKAITQLESFEEDKDIKSIVLRINSPGGAVAPSQEIFKAVKNYKKPVVASMASVATSGAYYVACGADRIFANPGSITGSIGVIMEFANLEKLYEWAKIRRYVIKTGKFKDTGSELREMDPEERQLLQGMVDDVLKQFKQAIADGRKLPMADITKLADGRVMSGSQAKTHKLIDELGTMDDAIQAAANMANLKGKPRVVYAKKLRRKWLEFLLDDVSNEDALWGSALDGVPGGLLQTLRQFVLGRSHSVDGLSGQITPGVYWLWSGTF